MKEALKTNIVTKEPWTTKLYFGNDQQPNDMVEHSTVSCHASSWGCASDIVGYYVQSDYRQICSIWWVHLLLLVFRHTIKTECYCFAFHDGFVKQDLIQLKSQWLALRADDSKWAKYYREGMNFEDIFFVSVWVWMLMVLLPLSFIIEIMIFACGKRFHIV